MHPIDVDFVREVHAAIAVREPAFFAELGAAIQTAFQAEQSQDLRISDTGNCSRAIWAKLNGKLDIPESTENIWSRLDLGTIVGVLIGKYFANAMALRGEACELERVVAYRGMTGHIDVTLPAYRHVYELKSNYGIKVDEEKPSHRLQAGIYCLALAEEQNQEPDAWTASVILIKPALFTGKQRMYEFPQEHSRFWVNAEAEADRLVACRSVSMPAPDPTEDWQCKSCRFSLCEKNRNPLRQAT